MAGKVPAIALIASQGFFSCLLGLTILGVTFYGDKSFKAYHGFGTDYLDYICIASICGIGYVAQWSLTRGGQLLIAGLASLMRSTDIAWSFLLGLICFHQKPNVYTIIGAVVMFFSILMVSLEKLKSVQQPKQDDKNIQGDYSRRSSFKPSLKYSLNASDAK